jgi:hypothetical protein
MEDTSVPQSSLVDARFPETIDYSLHPNAVKQWVLDLHFCADILSIDSSIADNEEIVRKEGRYLVMSI